MIDDVKYCILGTGFAGTCTLWHLVDQLTSPQRLPAIAPPRITIVTVERGAVNGPGYPYLEANVLRSHRCNNQASTMAIHGNDFVDWMTEHKPRLVRDYPDLVLETHPGIELAAWQPDGDNFYPRSLFGRYLTERFDEAVERAIAHGIHVQHYLNHEVIDASPQGDRLSIRLRNLETDHELWIGGFDRALLSTGHWQTPVPAALAGRDGYLASPYPPAAVKTALAAALRTRRVERPCVFVQGMGPSGIDAILTVCDDGEFIYTPDGHVASYRPAASSAGGAAPRVIVGSRCGLFSLVRGPLVDYQMRYLTEEALAAIRRDHQGHAKIERVLELVERELRHATAGALGWGDIEQPALPVARDKLSDALRESHTGSLVYTVILKARRLRFYSSLAPADKAFYDRALNTHFIRTAVPMPPANAEKLLALMDAGVLTAVRLGYDSPGPVAQDDGGFAITYRAEDGQSAVVRVDAVIRASGQDFEMTHHPSALLQNLLMRGEVVPHQESGYVPGGIALDGSGYRVIKRHGGDCVPSPYLASFGSPVRFWQNERNFAAAFVEAATWVAGDWTEHAVSATGRPLHLSVSNQGDELWR